ncbi:MAG: aldo/keto reductase [Collinsella sp.]|nr:aldo/keto reductase [Collinsella sp.]
MRYRIDPRNGDRISALGLGCMRFPGYRVGHPDLCAAEAIISRALELGVNYLDTAYLYPGNEECVGTVLSRLGARDRVLLATKLPHASCASTGDFDRFLTEQLERLSTDHIDYYLMHNITSPRQWERLCGLGIEEWVERQKRAGRIRRIGFSYHGSAVDFPVLLDAFDWDFCQIQYNYANECYQAGTAGLNAAADRGLAVFVMEPLLGGRLADRLPAEAARILSASADPDLHGPVDWALSWVWDHPQVTMLLSGMDHPEQVEANARVADLAVPGFMDEGRLDAIRAVVEVLGRTDRIPCTGCNYCMPCPHDIDIPGCFAAYNASFAHGWFTGISQYLTASAVRTKEPRLVDNCVGCGLCARHCPQGIDIPSRLGDVRKRFTPGPLGAVIAALAGRAGR